MFGGSPQEAPQRMHRCIVPFSCDLMRRLLSGFLAATRLKLCQASQVWFPNYIISSSWGRDWAGFGRSPSCRPEYHPKRRGVWLAWNSKMRVVTSGQKNFHGTKLLFGRILSEVTKYDHGKATVGLG